MGWAVVGGTKLMFDCLYSGLRGFNIQRPAALPLGTPPACVCVCVVISFMLDAGLHHLLVYVVAHQPGLVGLLVGQPQYMRGGRSTQDFFCFVPTEDDV